MSETDNGAAPAEGAVAALAASAVETAANTAAHVDVVAAATAVAVEEIQEETEEELSWLRDRLTAQELATAHLQTTLEQLPANLAGAIHDAIQKVLKSLTPEPQQNEPENPVVTQENPVVPETETPAPAPRAQKVKFL